MRVSQAPSPPATPPPPAPCINRCVPARCSPDTPKGVPGASAGTPSPCQAVPRWDSDGRGKAAAVAWVDGSQRWVRVRVGVLSVAQYSSSSSHVNLWPCGNKLTHSPASAAFSFWELTLQPWCVFTDVCLLIFTLQTNWLTKRRSTSLLRTSWTRHSANCLATKHCRSALPPPPLFLCPAGLLHLFFFYFFTKLL